MKSNHSLLTLFLLMLVLGASCSSKNRNRKKGASLQKRGLNFNDKAYQKIPKKASLTRGLYDNLPNSVTLQSLCPKVNQQEASTCVGWSTAYYARTILFAKEHQFSSQSQITENAFAPGFTYRAASMVAQNVDNDCGNGTHIDMALAVMQKYGAMPLRDFEDECYRDRLPDALIEKAKPYRIQSFTRLTDKTDAEAVQIKKIQKSLSESNPVVIGMETLASFMKCKSEIWSPSGNERSEGGHAMCVIGYDNSKGGGAFQIINSWGASWANNGFVWVRYSDFLKYTRYAFEMVSNIKHPEPAPPSPSPKPVEVPKEYLSGSLQLKLDGGNEIVAGSNNLGGMDVVPNTPNKPSSTTEYFTYQTTQTSGARFRIYLNNNEPAFVYAFSVDETRRFSMLFPHSSGISPALNYSKNTVALPDEDHYIQLDTQKGTDMLCILYSKSELDIQPIQTMLKTASGNFSAILQTAFGDKLIQPNLINYEQQKIQFKAVVEKGYVVPILVAFNHQ